MTLFPEYEVWQRCENFERWLSAAVVIRLTGADVTINLVRDGEERTELLAAPEVQRAREHLASAYNEDLSI